MNILNVLQLIISLFIIICVVLQARGNSGGIAFGGGGESYRSKRGLEKVLFYATIILAAFFALVSILALINQ